MIKLKKNKTFYLLSFSLFYATLNASAQQSFVSSGSEAVGNGGIVSYSIGQVAYTYNSDKFGNIEEGVQHAYEIYTLEIESIASKNWSMTVFPNPVQNFVTLEIENYSNEKFQFRLYDISGKLIETRNIDESQTKIDMESLATSTYIIDVLSDEQERVKSFKVIKNNH